MDAIVGSVVVLTSVDPLIADVITYLSDDSRKQVLQLQRDDNGKVGDFVDTFIRFVTLATLIANSSTTFARLFSNSPTSPYQSVHPSFHLVVQQFIDYNFMLSSLEALSTQGRTQVTLGNGQVTRTKWDLKFVLVYSLLGPVEWDPKRAMTINLQWINYLKEVAQSLRITVSWRSIYANVAMEETSKVNKTENLIAHYESRKLQRINLKMAATRVVELVDMFMKNVCMLRGRETNHNSLGYPQCSTLEC
nr:hypothetical protein [Tanacetum cinerariifolium]